LKKNQILGGKGGTKRMTQVIKRLLESMFLNGNANPQDKLTAQEMLNELQEFASSGEIQQDDIPKVSTIHNWITRYNREFKENATKQAKRALEDGQPETSIQAAQRTSNYSNESTQGMTNHTKRGGGRSVRARYQTHNS
jgi:tRNA G37 N-methylase TrmD